jgi:lysozyme
MELKTSKKGLELIEKYEGFYDHAYLCPAYIWTIGYGHTRGVKAGDECSREQAAEYLAEDVEAAEVAVTTFVCPFPRGYIYLRQEQFDALVSLVFNIGATAFHSSTLLKYILEAKWEDAANQFLVWDHANGVVSPGLLRRRVEERELFLSAIGQ